MALIRFTIIGLRRCFYKPFAVRDLSISYLNRNNDPRAVSEEVLDQGNIIGQNWSIDEIELKDKANLRNLWSFFERNNFDYWE